MSDCEKCKYYEHIGWFGKTDKPLVDMPRGNCRVKRIQIFGMTGSASEYIVCPSQKRNEECKRFVAKEGIE